ncbi:effector-associated domain 2-containing protein [Streptomyces sp. LaBMicrA B280]|uniref:effector-associated domain 2-containing protein n=1 Tax=Streptomyces sp. LaBMicrA B280 TaxID=3391001 RepID=UPI003BA7DD8E
MRGPGEEGLDAARVAEVLVAGTPGRRGSGYRVGDGHVLTAAHVVAGTSAVRVRFDADLPGEWSAPARVVLSAAAADVALLEIEDVPADRTGVDPPRYAAVPDADVMLPFSAMGFPRFKLRESGGEGGGGDTPGRYRDSCHVTGTVSVLSNRREGTLELAVAAPPADPEPHRSPWEGMSGALVWWSGAVIGVVSAHHRADGLGRLAARRVERWYESLSAADLERLGRYAGLPSRVAFGLTDGVEEPRPAVALAELPSDLPLRELVELVDALIEVPLLRSGNGMGFVLDSINDQVAANCPRDHRLRMDVYGVVRTCLRYPGTLDQFLEAIRLLEGCSPEVARMDSAAARLARFRR